MRDGIVKEEGSHEGHLQFDVPSFESVGARGEPRVDGVGVSGPGRVGGELGGFHEEAVGGGAREMRLRLKDDFEGGEG